jgi:Transposase, Mutator family
MRADYTMNDAAGGSESTSTTDWPARSRQPPVDRPLTLSTGANKPLLLRGSQGRGATSQARRIRAPRPAAASLDRLHNGPSPVVIVRTAVPAGERRATYHSATRRGPRPPARHPTVRSTRTRLGRKNPHTVAVFDNAWERFTPFLAFPPMLRRVIYTTNSIESLNYQLRKIIKNRGHFPNDDAVIKLLWLAICTIEDKRARDRAKEAGLRRGAKRKAEGHLVEGQTTTSWKQALAQLALIYPDRINPHL